MLENPKTVGAIAGRICIFLFTSITLPVQALFNRRLGERFLSLPRIALALVAIPWLFDMRGLNLEDAKSFAAYRSNYGALLAFAGVMLWQWLDTQDAIHRRGMQWHSRSPGVPWRFLGPDGKWQRLGVQPALCLFIGAIAAHWSKPLGQYFALSGAFLVVGWLAIYAAYRNQVLDMQDSILNQQALTQALNTEGTTTEDTFGLPIQESITPAERNNAPALSDIINELRGSGALSSEPSTQRA